jgi:AcrR family transcriptional regulator
VATVLQAVLFPSTPVAVLAAGRATSRRRHPPAAFTPRPAPEAGSAKLQGLTARSAGTVRRIMTAGAECFAVNGYHRTSVDDIVRRAGFARGTFYKYFSEKLDLLRALSDECEDKMFDQIVRFSAISPDIHGAGARREWLAEFLDFRAVYIGVIRAWIDRSPADAELERTRLRVNQMVNTSLETLVGSAPLADIVTIRAAEVLLTGVLERLPDAMVETGSRTKRGQVVELMAIVIERGLLDLDVHAGAVGA